MLPVVVNKDVYIKLALAVDTRARAMYLAGDLNWRQSVILGRRRITEPDVSCLVVV